AGPRPRPTPRPPRRGWPPSDAGPAAVSFFPRPAGWGVGRPRVARAGDLEGESEIPQPPPPGLRADRDPPPVADVRGDLRAGPQSAVGRSLLERRVQGAPLARRQLRIGPVALPPVGDPVGAVVVPPVQDGPYGHRRQPDHV